MPRLSSLLLALSLTLPVATPALAGGRHGHGPVDRRDDRSAQVEERMDALLDRSAALHQRLDAELDRIVQLAERADDWRVLPSLREATRSARALRVELARVDARIQLLCRRQLAAESLPPVPPCPLSEEEFAVVLGALDQEHFSDGKMAVLQEVARRSLFTVAEVREVMDQFAFGDDKVNAAALLYPRTVDPDHWFLVYQGLTFGSEKEELRRRTS